MTFEEHMCARIIALGFDARVDTDVLYLEREPRPIKILIDEEWRSAYQSYSNAKSLSLDSETRQLLRNTSVEVLLTRLSSTTALPADPSPLTDRHGNTVTVGPASAGYSLALFDSDQLQVFFKTRIGRILKGTLGVRRISHILFTPTTATYTHKGRRVPSDINEQAVAAIKKCLFKIAVEQHDCLTIWKPKKTQIRAVYGEDFKQDFSMPRATYDENVVSYYKVAKASPFPSQSYLAYYHVLEYYFLRVSELLLHDRLTAMLNNPSFHPDRDGLDKVISAVRGQDARSDETEMLRSVLDRFIQESDLINFISKFEEDCSEKLYSKKRTIFGEHVQISVIKDHAISNTAKTLKHIRNAIVHSSDRYKRDDRHIPLSESEDTIAEFLPLIRFVAEKVIFGTAV